MALDQVAEKVIGLNNTQSCNEMTLGREITIKNKIIHSNQSLIEVPKNSFDKAKLLI